MSETFNQWLKRERAARKHGRHIKGLGTPKFEILSEIFEDKELSEWDKLQLAFNYGYAAGAESVPNPLYNAQGKQIREVTQAELDWSL